jgi:hypothetical protein
MHVRTVQNVLLGTQVLTWWYLAAFQVMLLILLTSAQWWAPAGAGRVIWFIVVGLGELWWLYHAVRKLGRLRDQRPSS